MSYTPVSIQIYNALRAAFAADFSTHLVAQGQLPVDAMAFEPKHPAVITGDTVAVVYANTDRQAEGMHWRECTFNYELQLFAYGVSAVDVQHRVMWFEYSAIQVLDHNRTLGGLCVTLKPGDSIPAPMISHDNMAVCDGVIVPVSCQPADRIQIPEYAL